TDKTMNRFRRTRWQRNLCSSVFICGLLLLTLLDAASVSAANRYDPRLRFRTIRSAHFAAHAHEGAVAPARVLAGVVERVRQKYEPVLGVPRGRVQVILVDQTDLSNGWGRPVPYDTTQINPVPP